MTTPAHSISSLSNTQQSSTCSGYAGIESNSKEFIDVKGENYELYECDTIFTSRLFPALSLVTDGHPKLKTDTIESLIVEFTKI